MSRRRDNGGSLYCDVEMPTRLLRVIRRHHVTPAEYQDIERKVGAGQWADIEFEIKADSPHGIYDPLHNCTWDECM